MTGREPQARPALHIEEALVDATRFRASERGDYRIGLPYPRQLGVLAVETIQFDADYDADRMVKGVVQDFKASYETEDTAAGQEVRAKSLAWMDWLAQQTNLAVHNRAYLQIATTAAKHGDADSIRDILTEPRRLWLDKYNRSVAIDDPDYGRLDRKSNDALGGVLTDVARLLTYAPEERAQAVHDAVMPTVGQLVAEYTSRDLSDGHYAVGWTIDSLVRTGTSEGLGHVRALVDALPKTSFKVETLNKLARRRPEYAAEAAKLQAWYDDKSVYAREQLTSHIRKYGDGIRYLDDRTHATAREAAQAQQDIGGAIAYRLPTEPQPTSRIETSLAYVTLSQTGGTVDGAILRGVRMLTHNPHLELADPQFGFTATFEGGNEAGYARGIVTVFDRNLPDGRLELHLAEKPFWANTGYNDVRTLCRMIQQQKNRIDRINSSRV